MKKIILTSILISISLGSALGAQLAGGTVYSMTLKEIGTVWEWGHGLADGLINSPTPVLVSGLTDVISISGGGYYSLAVKRDGTAWARGKNEYGELGDGTRWLFRSTYVQVVGLSDVSDISARTYHSMALKRDGTVWAWGWNFSGQLGDGTTKDSFTPVQVVGLTNASAISVGTFHSMALKEDGTVWAWGYNGWGLLGDGTTEDHHTPVQVSGLTDVISIDAGGYGYPSPGYSLAVKRDGTVWAWGNNSWGQLGDGTTEDHHTPVQVNGLPAAIDIKGGLRYSLALASDGTVWFFGRIYWDLQSTIPVPVEGISDVKAIAAGYEHALALKNDGTLWAWGRNDFGQLGDGTTTYRYYPVQVGSGSAPGSTVPEHVLAADMDSDGRADPIAVDSSGNWYFWYSHLSFSRDGPYQLGMTGTPAAGDVDGDGRADMALVSASGNPSTGSTLRQNSVQASSPQAGSGQAWYFWLSSRGYSLSESVALGVSGSPVLADFDGDGKADPVMVDSSGRWYFWLSADRYSRVSAPLAAPGGGTPLAGDFDGDGRADPVMVSSNGGPSTGSGQAWYFWFSSSMYIRNGPYNFGLTGKPAAGDFDGDGKADPAMMDSSGNWYFWLSGSFYTRAGPFYLVLP